MNTKSFIKQLFLDIERVMKTQLIQARVQRFTKTKGWINIRTNATGGLVNSIESIDESRNHNIKFDLIGNHYWKYLQDKTFGTPPLDVILEWMKARGIPDDPDDDPIRVAFMIIEHLRTEGSNNKYSIFFQTTNKYLDNRLKEVPDVVNKDIADMIVEGI